VPKKSDKIVAPLLGDRIVPIRVIGCRRGLAGQKAV